MLDVIKKAVKHSAIFGLGTISTKLIGFVLLPLYTSYITVEEYGVLAVTEITSLILVALIGLKIDGAFFRWYWDKEYISKQKSIFFSSLVVVILTGLISLAIFFVLAVPLSNLFFSTEKYSYLLQLMLFSSVIQVYTTIIFYLMRAQEKPVFFSATTIIRLLVTLILTIVFIVNYNRGINGIYEAQIIAQFVFILITFKYTIENVEFKFETKITYEMLQFSIPLILAEISGIVLTVADRYCLNFLDTPAGVGIYSLGFKMANTIRMFVYTSAMMAISPMIYQYMDKPGNMRFYSKLLTYFAFIIMLFVMFLSFFSKESIELLASNKDYWPAWELIPLLSIGIYFGIIKDVSITGLNIKKKTNIIAYIILAMAIINILLNFLFIPLLSVHGATIASFITKVISFIIFYYFSQKLYHIPYEIKKVILVTFWGMILIAVSLFITLSNLNVFLAGILKLGLFIIFPVILYYFNFFEEIELLRINQSWQKWKNPFNWFANIKKIKI